MKLDPVVRLEDLPIPEDAQPTRLWTGQMLEMAAHIGPYATLLLVDRLGGQSISVPMDPAHNRMAQVIGEEKTAIMSRVYGGNYFTVPRGRAALEEARRTPVIAAIRAGELTINEAVPIVRTTRQRLSYLVNHGTTDASAQIWKAPRPRGDPRQIDLFPDDSA